MLTRVGTLEGMILSFASKELVEKIRMSYGKLQFRLVLHIGLVEKYWVAAVTSAGFKKSL